MRITKSNILLGKAPTVTVGSSSDDPANVTDPDFSTHYTGTSSSRLTFSFGAVSEIDYIAVAGINTASGTGFNSGVAVLDGGSTVAVNTVIRNNCVLISFDARAFSNLVVTFTNASNNLPRVSFIAGGKSFDVPNGGENSGYNRQFLNRNFTSKNSINNLAAPTSYLKKKQPAKGRLNLPNMTKEFSEGEYQEFLDFAVDNYFFIREQDSLPENSSAYLCYNLNKNQVTAHSQTRSLNNISFSFSVFNGL